MASIVREAGSSVMVAVGAADAPSTFCRVSVSGRPFVEAAPSCPEVPASLCGAAAPLSPDAAEAPPGSVRVSDAAGADNAGKPELIGSGVLRGPRDCWSCGGSASLIRLAAIVPSPASPVSSGSFRSSGSCCLSDSSNASGASGFSGASSPGSGDSSGSPFSSVLSGIPVSSKVSSSCSSGSAKADTPETRKPQAPSPSGFVKR